MTKGFAEHNEVWFCTVHAIHLTPCCPGAVNIGWFDTFNILPAEKDFEKD